MLPFSAMSDLVETRGDLRAAVDSLLESLRIGVLPGVAERQLVDVKEEAGRRGRGGTLLPGQAQNLAAATQLADEVACFANTPHGGALLVGVEDATGDLLGTALDADWLRHRIYERIDVAPVIDERWVDGVRLLAIYVAMASEPVEDTGNNIRWRVGSHCVRVDRAEWWQHRQEQAGYDSMSTSTTRTMADVSPGSIVVARRYLQERGGSSRIAEEGAAEILRRLGVLRPDGHLTQAGAVVFCATETTVVSLSAVDVDGGDVIVPPQDYAGLSVIEQLAAVEDRLDALNTEITLRGSFAETTVRRLPKPAVREAVLNGLVHRDWMPAEPVTVVWTQEDSALQVLSPGGFVGGVTAENLLTQRAARHPALADLFRALDLVEKQGLGVDRMYREMVALGHRPPLIVEESGPRVRVRLRGGQPAVPVMALVDRIEPAARRRDVKVAMIVDTLLREPFTTAASMAVVLQRSHVEAEEALETASECRVGAVPLIVQFKGVWLLSSAALSVVEALRRSGVGRVRGLLPYRRPDDPIHVVRSWLAVNDKITSGDHATLTGLTSAGALNQLERLVAEGALVRGTGRGRYAHFLPGPDLRPGPS